MATKTTLKNKGFKTLSAGKNLISGGPSGGMHKNTSVGAQAPDTTAVKGGGGKSKSFGSKLPTGGSGKMHSFAGTKPQKSGRTSQA